MRLQKTKILAPFIILLISLFNRELFAQKLTELTPPSPTAYELGKYGQTPVGLFSGTINSAIPLYVYRTKNLSVPISLNYSSNGIKVDELGTNVGLGWSLSMGGAITRMVRDLPDGINTLLYPEESIHKQNALSSPEVLEYFNAAGNNPDIDSETDVYMFNFNGNSGKFVMDNDRKFVMIPKQDVKIENVVVNTITGFKITTADGIQYTFLDKESSRNRPSGGGQSPAQFYNSAWYLTTIKHPNGDELTFVYENEGYGYIASQQQSLTVTPPQTGCSGATGSTFIKGPIINYNLTVRGLRLKEIHSNIPEEGKVLITSSTSHAESGVFQLVSALQVVDKSNLEMERVDFTYLKTANKRVFLQKLSMKDPNKSYQFTYNSPDAFPARLSFGQDHWGYANGAPNQYLFPNLSAPQYNAPDMIKAYNTGADKEPNSSCTGNGLLKQIIYPTKGYSNFTYESNTYSGNTVVLPPLITKSIEVKTDALDHSSPSKEQITPAINFDHDATLAFHAYFTDLSCTDYLHAKASFSIQDLTTPATPPIVYLTSISGSPSPLGSSFFLSVGTDYSNTAYVHLTAGHTYKIRIVGTGQCITAGADLKYYEGTMSTVTENKITGGMRVQKVETSDGVNASPQITRYYYARKESLNNSTGEKGLIPSYLAITQERQTCPPRILDVFHYEISSNSLNALYNSIGTNTTGYSFVTVSNGGNNFENGGEEHEFILDGDIPGKNILGELIPSAPWTNLGFSNGKEKKINTFKKAASGSGFTVLKTQNNVYTEDPRYHEEVFGYSIRKKYETSTYTAQLQYVCQQSDVDRTWSFYKCTSNHTVVINNDTIKLEHNPGVLFGSNNWICISPGANNVLFTIYDQCKAKGAGGIIYNLNILENLEITEYRHISTWEYLNSSSTTVYDLNGANPVTTIQNFFYDNPVHLQLTRTETSNTGGMVLKEKTYYPDDVISVSSLPGGNLAPDELNAITLLNKSNQYRINTPVQVESYRGAIKCNTTRTIYKPYGSLILPNVVRTLTGEASSTNLFRDRVNYYTYDATGNILEGSLTNDIYTSYLWGYNNLYPIAITKNARANEIMYNGFEESTGWNGLTAYDAARSHSGKYSGRIDKPTVGEEIAMGTQWLTLNSGRITKYKYSGWVYSNGPSVDLALLMKTSSTVNLQSVTTTVVNKWVYLEGEFDVPANVTQLNLRIDNNGGGSVWFDDIRLHPSVAQMSTYTYQPLTGLTSAILPNQQLTKYEYNLFNRLRLTRNSDGAILQRFQYKYK